MKTNHFAFAEEIAFVLRCCPETIAGIFCHLMQPTNDTKLIFDRSTVNLIQRNFLSRASLNLRSQKACKEKRKYGPVTGRYVLNKNFIICDSESTFVFSSISLFSRLAMTSEQIDVNFGPPLELKLCVNLNYVFCRFNASKSSSCLFLSFEYASKHSCIPVYSVIHGQRSLFAISKPQHFRLIQQTLEELLFGPSSLNDSNFVKKRKKKKNSAI